MAGSEIAGLADTPEEAAAMTEMAKDEGGGAPPAAGNQDDPPAANSAQQQYPPAQKQEDEPPAAAAPAAPPATAKENEPKAPQRVVPHAALHEERTRRQQVERELAELKGQKPPPANDAVADEEPDENTDPLATIAWLKGELKQLREQGQQSAESARVQEQIEDLGNRLRTRVDPYVAEHPEYTEQLEFIRQSRANELRLQGYDPATIQRTVGREEIMMGARILNQDLDPGPVVADLAKLRGWQPKKQEEPAKQDPQPGAAEARLDQLARGRKAAVSPSKSGGGSPAAEEMTLEQLNALDGPDFDKAFEKHGKRLFG